MTASAHGHTRGPGGGERLHRGRRRLLENTAETAGRALHGVDCLLTDSTDAVGGAIASARQSLSIRVGVVGLDVADQRDLVPVHAEIAGFAERLLVVPAVVFHAVARENYAGTVGAAFAVNEDRAGLLVVEHLKRF